MRSVRGMWMGVGVSNLSIQGTRHGPHAHSLNLRLPTEPEGIIFLSKSPLQVCPDSTCIQDTASSPPRLPPAGLVRSGHSCQRGRAAAARRRARPCNRAEGAHEDVADARGHLFGCMEDPTSIEQRRTARWFEHTVRQGDRRAAVWVFIWVPLTSVGPEGSAAARIGIRWAERDENCEGLEVFVRVERPTGGVHTYGRFGGRKSHRSVAQSRIAEERLLGIGQLLFDDLKDSEQHALDNSSSAGIHAAHANPA